MVRPQAEAKDIGNPDERIRKAFDELLRVFRDPESSVEQVSEKLQAYRKARQQVQDELEKAVEELRKLLTLRQQAIFMIQGILD